MPDPKHVLLLVGSPRGLRSSSASLGAFLLAELANWGWAGETLCTPAFAKGTQWQQRLCRAVDRADLLVLSAPLYVDGPPAPVVRALEIIADYRRASPPPRPGQQMIAISNCGFPEAHHNQTALRIYRRFAREVGLTWLGGLALGAGEIINDQPLAQLGGWAQSARTALTQAAAALVQGQPIPPATVELMARPLVPATAYLLVATCQFLWSGWNNRAGWLGRRPYRI